MTADREYNLTVRLRRGRGELNLLIIEREFMQPRVLGDCGSFFKNSERVVVL
jgi:hypothetical protein